MRGGAVVGAAAAREEEERLERRSLEVDLAGEQRQTEAVAQLGVGGDGEGVCGGRRVVCMDRERVGRISRELEGERLLATARGER